MCYFEVVTDVCGVGSEPTAHCFFGCVFAKSVWDVAGLNVSCNVVNSVFEWLTLITRKLIMV